MGISRFFSSAAIFSAPSPIPYSRMGFPVAFSFSHIVLPHSLQNPDLEVARALHARMRSLRSRAFRALRARARPPSPPEFSPHFTTFPGRPQTAVHKKFAI